MQRKYCSCRMTFTSSALIALVVHASDINISSNPLRLGASLQDPSDLADLEGGVFSCGWDYTSHRCVADLTGVCRALIAAYRISNDYPKDIATEMFLNGCMQTDLGEPFIWSSITKPGPVRLDPCFSVTSEEACTPGQSGCVWLEFKKDHRCVKEPTTFSFASRNLAATIILRLHAEGANPVQINEAIVNNLFFQGDHFSQLCGQIGLANPVNCVDFAKTCQWHLGRNRCEIDSFLLLDWYGAHLKRYVAAQEYCSLKHQPSACVSVSEFSIEDFQFRETTTLPIIPLVVTIFIGVIILGSLISTGLGQRQTHVRKRIAQYFSRADD